MNGTPQTNSTETGTCSQAQRHHTLVRRPGTRNLEKQRLVETQAGTDLFG